ncbi:caspase family protein [Prosthecodimorpha staleyi]|uniref:Caspase family protein n=1 Tax=Prosthecodimorpha staleyi TaxID=2840188 RepID=A0A947D0H2_9HYPH|nr:caspase family protein [Prosthecodimorpha staleyi]MBT9288316.1 caspase family protein [Prosthecodimorpha staleyi]
MPRCLFSTVVALAATFVFATAAMADRRIALLIGNAAYRSAPALTNPHHDVELLRRTLADAGFDNVSVAKDLDLTAIKRTLRQFEDAAQNADIAVLYYSGHGLSAQGQNYLVPTDARLATDRDIEDETVSLDRVLRSLDGVRRLKLVLLDACRDNPFLATMARRSASRSLTRGLGRFEPTASDTLVGFATAEGETAQDGTRGASPFAIALAQHLATPGLDVEMALRKVRDDVMTATGGAQRPFKTGSIGGEAIALSRAATGSESTPSAGSSGPATASLAPATPAPRKPARRYRSPTGWFQKEGSGWVEQPPYAPGRNFRFEELFVDSTWIYLIDRSRKSSRGSPMLYRIPIAGGVTQWSYQNPMQWSDVTVVSPE